MNPVPQDPVTRDILSTVLGILVAAGGAFALYAEMMPWYAAMGTVGVGLYLTLPRRMRHLGDWVTEKYKEIKN